MSSFLNVCTESTPCYVIVVKELSVIRRRRQNWGRNSCLLIDMPLHQVLCIPLRPPSYKTPPAASATFQM